MHLAEAERLTPSADYIKVLKGSHIVPSITEDGNPKDNAMAERITNTVKWSAVGLADNELLHGQRFASIKQVTDTVRRAVDFYNKERPRGSIDTLTPN